MSFSNLIGSIPPANLYGVSGPLAIPAAHSVTPVPEPCDVISPSITTGQFISPRQISATSDLASRNIRTATTFSLTEDSVTTLAPETDGGYVVDCETNTRAYYGDMAKGYLDRTTTFHGETQVILNSHGSLEVTVEGETLSFSEPGAVLLSDGAEAKFKTGEGDILVLTTEKPPGWYEKFAPEGAHKAEFEKIGRLNEKLFKCLNNRSLFSREELQGLVDHSIVINSPEYDSHVQWNAFRTDDEVRSRLIEAGFQGGTIDHLTSIWENTIKRKLYAYETGRCPKASFDDDLRSKLIEGNIMNDIDPGGSCLFWASIYSEDSLRSKLSELSIRGTRAESVVKAWKKSTRAGYDEMGLVWEKDKVVAYVLREKQNLWNEQHTEWIVNSTEYAGQDGPFCVGVSNVSAPQPLETPIPFKELRPGESLHRHPVKEDKKQTECYLVTGGSAALLTMRHGKPFISFMQKGDMAVISPGVTHCVIGASGNYEHLCFQVPSAFQYGFLFKETTDFESYGVSEQTLVESARKGLSSGLSGTVDANSLLEIE